MRVFKCSKGGTPNETEKGSTLLELAIALPFLVLLIFIVADLGMFLQSYLQMVHITRQGLRTEVAIPLLEGGKAFQGTYLTTNVANMVLLQTPGITNNHAQLHERIRKLASLGNGLRIGDTLDVESECEGDTVSIKVHANYQPIFSAFPTLPYTVSATGAYLFSGCK